MFRAILAYDGPYGTGGITGWPFGDFIGFIRLSGNNPYFITWCFHLKLSVGTFVQGAMLACKSF